MRSATPCCAQRRQNGPGCCPEAPMLAILPELWTSSPWRGHGSSLAGVAEGGEMTQHTTKQQTALSPAGKIGLGLAGIVQVVFAFLAFWDLAFRDADEVRGPKPLWIPAILVNWIGPAAYFLFGIKHRR